MGISPSIPPNALWKPRAARPGGFLIKKHVFPGI